MDCVFCANGQEEARWRYQDLANLIVDRHRKRLPSLAMAQDASAALLTLYALASVASAVALRDRPNRFVPDCVFSSHSSRTVARSAHLILLPTTVNVSVPLIAMSRRGPWYGVCGGGLDPMYEDRLEGSFGD